MRSANKLCNLRLYFVLDLSFESLHRGFVDHYRHLLRKALESRESGGNGAHPLTLQNLGESGEIGHARVELFLRRVKLSRFSAERVVDVETFIHVLNILGGLQRKLEGKDCK